MFEVSEKPVIISCAITGNQLLRKGVLREPLRLQLMLGVNGSTALARAA